MTKMVILLFKLGMADYQNGFNAGVKLGAPPRGSCRDIGRSAKLVVGIGFEFVIEQKPAEFVAKIDYYPKANIKVYYRRLKLHHNSFAILVYFNTALLYIPTNPAPGLTVQS